MTVVLLKCPQRKLNVRIILCEDQNPKFCEAFKKRLPLRTLPWHAVISGDNAGFFFPLPWLGFDNPQPRRTGDVFFYANCQWCIVCYGECSEPGKVNKFAEIHPDDMSVMRELGAIIKHSIYMGEDPYFLEISLAEEE